MTGATGSYNDTHTHTHGLEGEWIPGCRRPELDGVGDMDTDGQDKGRSASRRQTGGEAHPKLKGHGREKKGPHTTNKVQLKQQKNTTMEYNSLRSCMPPSYTGLHGTATGVWDVYLGVDVYVV